MIVTELIGGLGNQMFQYAAGAALAKRSGVSVRVDTTSFEHYTLRRYALEDFACAAEVADPTERLDVALHGQLLEERSALYEPRLEHPYPKAYLRGYWQCERYFQSIRRRLLSEFHPRDPLAGLDADIAAEMADSASVALHIRRGDYVANPHTNAFHGVLPVDYYRDALAFIHENQPAPEQAKRRYFIFSDDPDWCEEAYAFLEPKVLVRHNPPERGFMDLYLMAQAKHHVIANSSFSWWAAWLCRNPGQIVVAPRQWFAASHAQCQDIVPERWVRL